MKRIYDFSRSPSAPNYSVADLQALKGSGKKLSMSNPRDAVELRVCLDADIDLLPASHGGDRCHRIYQSR